MRTPAPETLPVALTIAGSDSGGGAGIQADLATMAGHDVYGTSAITAVTSQHSRGVERSYPLPLEEVEGQLSAVTGDFDIGAAKTGMLATTEIVRAIATEAENFAFPLVVDPVMVATSGDRLLEPEAERAYEDLIGEAAIVTPNADEAEVLTGITVEDEDSAIEAGEALLEFGTDAALVKGGHVPGETISDVLVTEDGVRTFEHTRVDTDATHGSGCTLAAAVAARLAKGDSLEDAVSGATDFLTRAVRYHYDVGQGAGAVNHGVEQRNRAAMESTTEQVRNAVGRIVEADISPLVPEVGTNVVGATPYADAVEETAAVEGRITRTLGGISPNGAVRFGASKNVARFLLDAREVCPSLRFACNLRFNEEVEQALEELGWVITELSRDTESETDEWVTPTAVETVFDGDGDHPTAIIDRGSVGKEAMTYLVAVEAETVADRVLELYSELD
ncbi:bifunctional hydroxymethylpyrimidine kinase/phosphomethylpyrimidine kinase [Halostagnicola sp. A-GB9-2]|uniref:bifunctional hydroxymethylpyrimidine kinase/phosphomethylpyrimidine kinase n=1 Tax=Halostagnicola sp. A-GB9-2 TaxID=3048066 RepID=UPI0024C09443|nr:bifunctional hydroxymethylpyrimidine kinase/phosphomethylpyrimidine kinase [Halostagnicola sp. A-GB9-2]MDJ1432236.1 bifunctional hydroxymethylpyrimidine kinase/phosphomethylpyrimidine kinase [Halostagnicola sp. A-GB9-2]